MLRFAKVGIFREYSKKKVGKIPFLNGITTIYNSINYF